MKVSDPIFLPTLMGNWLHPAVQDDRGKEHSAFLFDANLSPSDSLQTSFDAWKDHAKDAPVLMRFHSACRFGDVMDGLSCDCGEQLEEARRQIVERGYGAIIYLDQEGRGAGLYNKNQAVFLEQTQGLTTAQTFNALGLSHQDLRDYSALVYILTDVLGFDKQVSLELMTNNPAKLEAVEGVVAHVQRVPLLIAENDFSQVYLRSKFGEMGHMR